MIRLLKTFGVRRTLRILYIKHIKGQCRHCCDICQYWNECFDNIEWWAQMGDWILLEDGRPFNAQEVLVTHNYYGELEVECVRYLNGEWEQPDYGEWSYDDSSIIAWQPLPKPYTPIL